MRFGCKVETPGQLEQALRGLTCTMSSLTSFLLPSSEGKLLEDTTWNFHFDFGIGIHISRLFLAGRRWNSFRLEEVFRTLHC